METSIAAALVAGAAGGGLLLGARALGAQLDPRPCWQKGDCVLKRADAQACQSCPVYVDRDVPAEAFVIRDLRLPPLRRFGDESAAA